MGRKFGLGHGTEFKVLIETRDLAQLDAAFQLVSSRAGWASSSMSGSSQKNRSGPLHG